MKRKITQYLRRAEEIFNCHLQRAAGGWQPHRHGEGLALGGTGGMATDLWHWETGGHTHVKQPW